ncbi:hypothetical protein [Halopiger djelfimassiliensis]|uniref:hypothetical protein n=1 Tax=Halopiger djelfimassiliensis TaxID=1293047 RepID=UPI00067780CE|nr:hypothetical protein [Halopiger djelfimassiliensis]
MLGNLAAQFREYPVATALEVGSVLVCVLLFVGTFVALASGPPTGRRVGPWLAIVAVGAAFVLFWTVLVPLYERIFLS